MNIEIKGVGEHIEAGILTLRKLRECQSDIDSKALLIKIEVAIRQLKQEFTQKEDLLLLDKVVSTLANCPTAIEMATRICDIIDKETNQNKTKLSVLSEASSEIGKLTHIIRSLREQKNLIEERQMLQTRVHKLIYLIASLVCTLWVLCRWLI